MAETEINLNSPIFQDALDPREPVLLEDPERNADELYNIYGRRVDRVMHASGAIVVGQDEVEIFLKACARQRSIARLLPADDVRHYRFWGK